jgi:hypothetical protein
MVSTHLMRCSQDLRSHFDRSMAGDNMQVNDTHYKMRRLRWRGRHRVRLPGDQTLAPEQEPPLGAHMVTPRRGYTHHGIYVGLGRVVQYRGLSRGLARGPVEEVSLSQFAQGRPIRLRVEESRWSNRDEVARRARSRLGENRYNLLTNNCEHFCEWCVRGEHRSYQVDEWVARYLRTWHRFIGVLARAFLLRRNSAAVH